MKQAFDDWRSALPAGALAGGGTVFCLHSIGLDSRSFGPLHACLPDDWRLIGLDMRGHGRAASMPPATDFAAYVDDVAAALSRYHSTAPKPFHLLGHSMGGALAAAVAARSPDVVSLTVIASPPRGFPAFADRAAAVRGEGMAAAIPPTLARWFGESETLAGDADAHAARRYAEDALRELSASHFANAWDALAGFGGYDTLVSALPRTLLVIGGNDLSTPASVMASIKTAFDAQGNDSRCAVATIAEAGHMLPLTHAAQLAPALQRHWRDAAAATAVAHPEGRLVQESKKGDSE